jgi:hypothetical protein
LQKKLLSKDINAVHLNLNFVEYMHVKKTVTNKRVRPEYYAKCSVSKDLVFRLLFKYLLLFEHQQYAIILLLYLSLHTYNLVKAAALLQALYSFVKQQKHYLTPY